MKKILSIDEFLNESRGARLINRNPDRFNSDPLANKDENSILDKHVQKRFDYTKSVLESFCDTAYNEAINVFSEEYIAKRRQSVMLYPDGNGDFFRFVPKLETAYDDDVDKTGVKDISVACTYKVLMDVGGVVFPEGLSIINMVNDAVKNRYEYQMGLVLDEENYDNDEDRMLGLNSMDDEQPGMFYVNDDAERFFKNTLKQHNNGDYSNNDYDIKVDAREHYKYNNMVIELHAVPTLENYDIANYVLHGKIDKSQLEQYAEEFGKAVGEIFVDVFNRISDEYADVLR